MNVRLIFLEGTRDGYCHHGSRLVSSVEDEFRIIQRIIWFPFTVIEDFLFVSICLLLGAVRRTYLCDGVSDIAIMPICIRANLANDFILDITLAVLRDRNRCNNWNSSSHFLFSFLPLQTGTSRSIYTRCERRKIRFPSFPSYDVEICVAVTQQIEGRDLVGRFKNSTLPCGRLVAGESGSWTSHLCEVVTMCDHR